MALPINQTGGIMADQQHELRPVDRAYTPRRIEWMLENYPALLSRKPMSVEDKLQMASVVTSDSQWWSSQAHWRKIDRRADLDDAVTWATGEDYRKRVIIQYRYWNEPEHLMSWDKIAAMLALSRMHVWRLHRQIIADVSWKLGGTSDE